MVVDRRRARFSLSSLLVVLSLTAAAAQVNWPQWRGPASQGIAEPSTAPTAWSAATNIAWKTAIPGRGHSSPIVWGRRVFLTTAIEGPVVPGAAAVAHIVNGNPYVHPDSIAADREQTLRVLALDADTGRILWDRAAYAGRMFDGRHRRGSFASATPVTDGRALYVFFGTEGLFAYDLDGRELWRTTVGRIKTLGLGTASSPLLVENLVIVQCDDDEGKDSFIVAVDAGTGKEVWRTTRPIEVSWSSPVLVRTGSRSEVVTNGSDWVIAYDPRTGSELWRATGVKSNAIHTPLVGDGLVIVSAGFPAKRVIAMRPGGSGDVTSSHVVWSYDKGTAYVSTPILYRGIVYLLTDGGIVTALDAATGRVIYEGGRPPRPAKFMGSPVAFNGKVLLTSEEGDTFVVNAGPTFEVVETNSLGEAVSASLAVAGDRVFVRGDANLYCIRRLGTGG